MIKSRWRAGTGGTILVATALLGCGGTQHAKQPDPVALLAAGRYAEARTAAEAGGLDDSCNRAVAALSHLAESSDHATAGKAVDILLVGGNAVAAAAAADEMLGLIEKLPDEARSAVSLPAVEAALGSTGNGPLARSQTGPVPGSEVARSVAASVLRRLHLYLSDATGEPDAARLLDAWNGSYTLLGGSMSGGDDDVLAWKLYTATGGLAVTLDSGARDSDLTKVVLRSAVEVVEQNPDIATAVRCDLASPFDGLRSALTYNRELLGRLERAVASAVGCNRGKFAPQTQR